MKNIFKLLISLVSVLYMPLVSLYREVRKPNYREVFITKKIMDKIENSENKEAFLKQLYDIE